MKKHNFSAGPAILPKAVLQEAAQAVVDYQGIGLSLLELSHRGPEFTAVMDEALALAKELLQLDDNYSVMFLTGGASSQFFMAPMNLLDQHETAAYINTGVWATKAIEAARDFGNVEVVASSEADKFKYIPKTYTLPSNAKYLHITSNNTIYGTQYHNFPKVDVPVLVDMSSDIFSRPIDGKQFGMIYAGAQKNLGPAGTTLVAVRNDLLGKVTRKMPVMLNYKTHIKEGSMYNTPPVYPIYVCMLTMRWIQSIGGLGVLEARNRAKAELLYQEIDANPLFEGWAVAEDRSWMNVNFVMKNKDLESTFNKVCVANGIEGLKGHRSVGGFRASMYNAMEIDSVQVLVDVMRDFAQKNA